MNGAGVPNQHRDPSSPHTISVPPTSLWMSFFFGARPPNLALSFSSCSLMISASDFCEFERGGKGTRVGQRDGRIQRKKSRDGSDGRFWTRCVPPPSRSFTRRCPDRSSRRVCVSGTSVVYVPADRRPRHRCSTAPFRCGSRSDLLPRHQADSFWQTNDAVCPDESV